jgi:hypothetical protein
MPETPMVKMVTAVSAMMAKATYDKLDAIISAA